MSFMRVRVAKKVRKRLADSVSKRTCCNLDCKSTGEKRAVANRGLCQKCINAFRYERMRIAARRGEKAAIEYERRRLVEGSLLQAQECRDYARAGKAVG